MARIAAWLGWAVLGAAALVGLVLSAVTLLATMPFAREAVAARVVQVVDDAIAGSVKLSGIEVLPQGGIVLRELQVFDPDGHLVLAVGRARLAVDVTALRARAIGLEVELHAPSVLLEQERDGGVSLARALAPSHPSRPAAPERPRRDGGPGAGGAGGGGGGGGWTLHVSRLVIRGGDLWWVDAAGATRLEADGVDVDGRGTIGSRLTRAELHLQGQVREPIASPLDLEIVAAHEGDAVRVPLLRLDAGGSVLEALAEGDLARRRGRVALTRLAIAREDARALLPRAPEGSDLSADGYAESDGTLLTAALAVAPSAPGDGGGKGNAAVAARLSALGRAVGFDVALDQLDPSRIAAGAPAGEITLTARGAAAGSSLEDARGRVALSAARSRVRRGEITRADVQLSAAHGTVEVERLLAAAPGATVSGAGTWRRSGPVSGSATLTARDLGLAARNLERLLGKRLPPLGGDVRVAAELAGTAAAPALTGSVRAGVLRAADVSAEAVEMTFTAAGPRDAPARQADGKIGRLSRGRRELARAISVHGLFQRDEGTFAVKGTVPGSGPLSVEARARLGPGRESLALGELTLAWPGARWALVRPAMLDLRRPSVDRLELAGEGGQRLALAGGVRARGAIDARAELSRIDLARLPPGLLPEAYALRGAVSASIEGRGTMSRPQVRATVAVEDGAVRGVDGLSVTGEGELDAARRRASLALAVARAQGGTADVALDVPLPFGGRPGEPLSARVRAGDLSVADILRAAGRDEPAAGSLSFDARVEGTIGAPRVAAEISLADGAWRELEQLGATIELEDGDGTLRVSGTGSLAGGDVVVVAAEAPLDLGNLLARPEEEMRDLRRANVQGTIDVTSLDLAAVSGRAGLPPAMAGVVDAHAAFSGTASAPRGQARVELSRGAWKGWRAIGARVDLGASDDLAVSGTISVAGEEACRFEASLGVRPERLGDRPTVLHAPLRVQVVIPRVALAPMAGDVAPLSGTLEGHVAVSGTPRAPRVEAELAGSGVAIEGRPLGEAHATARYSDRRAEAEVMLRPASGGALRTTATLAADLGVGAEPGALRSAQAEVKATSDGVDLGFLPAVAPTRIRAAGGQLALDVTARGPLARLAPRGTVRVSGGRIAIIEVGDWTDIAIDARVTDDAIELVRLEARRGRGRLSAHASATGLRGEAARVAASVRAERFTVSRAGMDLANIDLEADADGTLRGRDLTLEVKVPQGIIRLPKKSPRPLQSLEKRKDIVVGRPPEEKKEAPRVVAAAPGAEPLSVKAHVVAPRRFFIKSESPKMDIELKADVRYELPGDYLAGSIQVVRGNVEPFGGRNFMIERGVVQFTGGPLRTALLDIVAKYHHPAAEVTATVNGPLSSPPTELVHLSAPGMTETQIAILLATGRTELKAGSGATSTVTGEDVGRAALGVLATQAFRDLVEDKLPLDVVALDASGLRTGKYATDRIYVGYTRRFDADPTKYENTDEYRFEFQITPRWMFEARYGDARSGGASLIWSQDR